MRGEVVTFHFEPDAVKVRAAGGGFGAGTDLTTLSDVTDHPGAPTTYYFKITRRADASTSGKPEPATIHASVTVGVYKGDYPALTTYHDTRGWRIDVESGWNRYSVPNSDPLNNAVIYFQKQPDDTDRSVVAITPVGPAVTSADLMKQVEADAPNAYNVFREFKMWPTTQAGFDATMASFKGIDQGRPDVPTESLVLTFVSGTHGYVLSARTRESEFEKELPVLHCLLRSFQFEKARVRPKSPAAPKGKK